MLPTEFERARFVSVSTFRRNGEPVATPLWFALDGDNVVIWTGESSGKVKRLRNNPAVRIQVCDARGRVRPNTAVYTGVASLLPATAGERVHERLDQKYTWQKLGLRWLNRVGTWFGRSDSALDDAFISIEVTGE